MAGNALSNRVRGVLLCVAVALSIAACAPGTTRQPGGATVAPPAGEMLYVLDGYSAAATSAQRIVAFQPNGASQGMALPAGLTSGDHQRLYTATTAMGFTTIEVVDTHSGKALRSFKISGEYAVTGPGYGAATLSADGRWLALRDLSAATSGTAIAVVDTQAGMLVQVFHLDGDFTLDAISPDASMVYLIQQLHDAANHYYVRAYDLNAGQLLDTIIVDKTDAESPQMVGAPLTRIMSRDGTVAYTLYTNPATNKAFVHILPLSVGANQFLFARCVDLPVGTSPALLGNYTLAMSSDESALYAANAALGVIVRIGLHGTGPGVFGDQIDNQNLFTPGGSVARTSGDTAPLYAGAALSADQTTLYVAGTQGVRAFDARALAPRRTYLAGSFISSVALSGDGKTLYAIAPGQGLMLIALASGQTQQDSRCPARAPWAIAWVAE